MLLKLCSKTAYIFSFGGQDILCNKTNKVLNLEFTAVGVNLRTSYHVRY